MRGFLHPKWKFVGQPQKTIYYGSIHTFPQRATAAEQISDFCARLDEWFAANGLEGCVREQKMYNTGGHSDIDYYALAVVDETGGCECVFYQMLGTQYEALRPFIFLYGAWVERADAWTVFLQEQYGSSNAG
ncbi:MAG: hypothetical protein VX278_13820 [Myxococcota bacterium]|nr:hypothetical protein [Myxococcota bacterium]